MNQRPPADVAYSEIFFDEKCGYGGEEEQKKFFSWCDKPSGPIQTKCMNFSGAKSACDMTVEFISEAELSKKPVAKPIFLFQNESTTEQDTINLTTTQTQTPIPEFITTQSLDTQTPAGIHFRHVCDLGPGKPHIIDNEIKFTDRGDYDKIRTFCHQKIYGVDGLPIWLVILIILLIVLVLCGACFLFWKYWLRTRVYGKPRGGLSTMESHWTVGPSVTGSTLSSAPSRSVSRSNSKVISRTRSQPKSPSKSGSLTYR